MRRKSLGVLALLCLALLFLPDRGLAAIDKATVEAAWNRIAAAGDMKDVPLYYEKDKAPNACTDCHAEQGPQWAVDAMEAWWPGSTARSKPTSGGGHPAVP